VEVEYFEGTISWSSRGRHLALPGFGKIFMPAFSGSGELLLFTILHSTDSLSNIPSRLSCCLLSDSLDYDAY
jgi:hypothetical protein